jgi:hypothetical protein
MRGWGNSMGLDIKVKGMAYDDTHHSGYITFTQYRIAIARAYNKEFGDLYQKYICDFFNNTTQEEINRMNELCDNKLDLLLNHSDCDGKLTPQECRAIYLAMKDLDVRYDYPTNNGSKMHELWLNMLRHCYKKRVNMYFY